MSQASQLGSELAFGILREVLLYLVELHRDYPVGKFSLLSFPTFIHTPHVRKSGYRNFLLSDIKD